MSALQAQAVDYLEGLLEGFVAYDENWVMTYMNGAAEEILGRRREDVLGKTWHQAFPHAPGNPVDQMYQRVMRTRQGERMEYFYPHYGRWLEISASAVHGSGVAVYFRDVTSRKAAEEGLTRSEAKYRTLFETIDQGFCIVQVLFDDAGKAVDYRFLEVNPQFERQTGLAGARGRTMRELAPGHEEHWFETYGRIATTGEPARFELPAAQLQRSFEVYAWRYGEPESRQVAILFNDITDREALNRVGRTLNSELDLERVVQGVTDAATELSHAQFGAFFYNLKNEAGESYTLYTISGVPREAFSKFPMPRNTAVFAPTFAGEGIVRSADITQDPRYGHNAPRRGMPEGHLPVRSYLAVPVVSRSGEVHGGLFFGHSATGVFDERAERLVAGIAAQAAVAIDNARLYRSLQESEQRLREADRRKDEFLAVLAHELRNPLAPVRTGLHLLRISPPGSEPAEQARAMMERQLGHLVRLVDDLLEVSRITSGKIELRRERVDLAGAVMSAVETSRPAIEAARHTLDVSLPPEPMLLHGDFVRLAQVLANLLNNAAKYTEPGGRIALSARREAGEAVIAVRDSGVGIAPEALPQLFEMFAQVDRSPGRRHGGLGIGLGLARRLVELHGGSIQARSDGPGRGAEFTVRLPLDSGALAEARSRPDLSAAQR